MIMIYVKYLPGNVFTNTFTSGLAQIISYPTAGLVYAKLGLQKSFTILFTLSLCGGIAILVLGFINADFTVLMPLFVLLAMCGVSGGFTLVYVGTQDVFPMLFCSTAIGICNFTSRFTTIFSDEVAEIKPPLPMILFSSIVLLGAILIHFAKTLEQQRQEEE